jgi:protease-4
MRFITRLFAVIGLLVVLLIVGAAVSYSTSTPKIADSSILTITLDGELQEKTGFDPLNFSHALTLVDAMRALHEAAVDKRIKGVFLNIEDNLPLTQAQELHASIAAYRKSGKPIYAFADTFGEQDAGAAEYSLAAACDKVWLQPMGTVGLMGIAADEFFLKSFLARNGVQLQASTREQYKTAFDNFTQDGFTPANREMTQSLLSDMVKQIVASVAADRKLDPAAVRKAMDTGPISADAAKALNLIDEIDYRDQALDDLEDLTSAEDTVSARRYLESLKTKTVKNKIAVIYAVGELSRHSGMDPMDPLSDNQASDPRDVFDAFRDASEDDDVKAIVFRINSPGGSVVASETIRGGVLLAKDAGKPIIVSMGEMAGSGGYWIAADADRIIAEPATLTGSIGVLGGKPVIGDLLREHGINTDAIQIGQNANMDSPYRAFTPGELAKQNAMLDDIYTAFKDVVSQGRKIAPAKVEQIAKGRVYTGAQAVSIGLVDETGGMETAITRAREAAGLSANDAADVVEVPATPSALDYILSYLNGGKPDDDDDALMGRHVTGKLKLLTALRPYLHMLMGAAGDNTVRMPIKPLPQ